MIIHKEDLPHTLGYPGSTAARDNGCRCQPLRNLQGSGIKTDYGIIFVTDPDCPLHGIEAISPPYRRSTEEPI
jgi:hypothetical protein